MPFFSVIVPVFKHPEFLLSCLTSIIEQSFTDYELLLIYNPQDERNTDLLGIEKVLDSIVNKSQRATIIKAINNYHQGVARNTAISHARGKYVVFVDSDDLLPNDALLNMNTYISDLPLDLALFSYEKNYNNRAKNQIVNRKLRERMEKLIQSCGGQFVSNKEHKKLLLLSKGIGAPWAKAYRLEFLKVNQIEFAINLKFEDVKFFVLSIMLAKSIGIFNSYVYNYRKHDMSDIRTNYERNTDLIVVYQEIINYLQSKALYEIYCNEIITKMLKSFIYHFKKIKDISIKKQFWKQVKIYVASLSVTNQKVKSSKLLKLFNNNSFYMFCLKTYIY